MHGYTGKLLRVDLTQRTHTVEPLNEGWARDFIGGRGLGAKYLFEEMDPRVDPLAPGNRLIFANGLPALVMSQLPSIYAAERLYFLNPEIYTNLCFPIVIGTVVFGAVLGPILAKRLLSGE